MQRRSSWILILAIFGCDAEQRRYDSVDTPTPIPEETQLAPEDQIAAHEKDPSIPDPQKVAKCVRGTGRNAEGECEVLRTREGAYGQQVQLPKGALVMGDIPARYDARAYERELRSRWSGTPPRIAPAPAVWVDLHEVTHGAYAKCVEAGKCTPANCEGTDDPSGRFSTEVLTTIPQTCVTHEQAEAFCGAYGGRLPSELEWEYAARGSDARIYPWGNEMRDEYGGALLPVSGLVDVSYFGLRGMGANATEWVAEPFELDTGLAQFISGPFREESNGLAKYGRDQGGGWVAKSSKAGARQRRVKAHGLLGFRCAADLEPGTEPLTIPEGPRDVPLVTNLAPLELFGGVAEALSEREAVKFCDNLSFDWAGSKLDDWRLPSAAEVEAAAVVFRGPGPFWTSEGAMEQGTESGTRAPDDPWRVIEAKADELFAARCVRSAS